MIKRKTVPSTETFAPDPLLATALLAATEASGALIAAGSTSQLLVLRETALSAVSLARALTITDATSYVAAADLVLDFKRAQDRVHELLDPGVKERHEAHKAATNERAAYLTPLAEAASIADTKLRTWERAEQQRQRDEAERDARIAADRAAQEKMAAAAELYEAGDAGSEAEAAALVAEVVERADTPLVLPPVRTVLPDSGLSRRTIMRFRVLDAAKIKREFMIPNEAAIGALVTKLGAGAVAIVGEGSIEVWPDASAPSAKRGRGVSALIRETS